METTQEKMGRSIKSILGHIELEISMDRLQAFLSLYPEKDMEQGFSESEVRALLTEEGIVHGINSQKIEDCLKEVGATRKPVTQELIAMGTPMEPQQDATIQYQFRTNSEISLEEDETGRINYFELGLINTVEQGEVLAKKIPCQEGISGLTIYGEVVHPGTPKDIQMVTGRNVELSEDGLECLALCSGQVLLKNRIIHVSPIYEVPHDVDLNVGNISFNGAVLVRGNVLSGFSIRAKENITVLGVVEGAEITCGGILVIKGGIKGSDKCNIRSKGNLITSFIEGAAVECHGNLFVDTAILNSHIRCFSKIKMGSSKGHIVGGEVLGVQGVECQETGSKLGVRTQITVGDKLIVRERLSKISTELDEQQNILKKIDHGMAIHKRLFEQIEILPEDKQAPLREVLNSRQEVLKKVGELSAALDKLQNLYQFRCLASLKVFQTIYPNTIVHVGHSHLNVEEKLAHCGFFENHEERVVEINPLA